MGTLTRRGFLQAGAGAMAAAAAPGAFGARPKSTQPHILLLMADQFRGDCVGADGNRAIHTPHLDWLAHTGIRFSRAYSSTPTCTPARAGLLTGLSPWRHGMLGYGKVAEKYPIEMPQTLRDAGYSTCGIGKMHYHPQRNPHGFEQMILDESSRVLSPDFRSDYRAWFASVAPTLDACATGIGWNDYDAKPYVLPENLHPTHWTGETAVRYIKDYARPNPVFLKVSFARPHSPYDPPERFWKKYRDEEMPAPSVGAWASRYAPRSGPESSIWHGDLGVEQARRSRHGYYGSIAFVDEQIGRILDALDRRKMLDDTLIVFTADHGDMTGDHNLWRKSYAYEASARIPMLMRWPDGLVSAKRGQVSRRVVELRDVLPTFMEAAHAAGAETLDGKSLLQLARNPDAEWREIIDLEHDICYSPDNHWSALTDGRWKYIYHAKDGRQQLFDLDADPHELMDLADDTAHADTLRAWRNRMIAHLEPRGKRWVKGGDLALRPESILYSPNYPKTET